MFKMLIDTCVWLDLAKDQKQVAVLGVIEEMVRRNTLSLIIPRLLLEEFRKNRERVAKDSKHSRTFGWTTILRRNPRTSSSAGAAFR